METERYKEGDLIENRYEVHRVITSGGFGVVYVCFDRGFGCPCVVKGFKDKYVLNDEVVENFRQEAYEWIQIGRHTNIVHAAEVHILEGRPYICMEYVSGAEDIGCSLADWIKHQCIDQEMGLKFALDIASGLGHAHSSRGLVHRDVKPANILIDVLKRIRDKLITAKVTDFGLAKATKILKAYELGKDSGETLDSAMATVSRGGGTPGYMAPEQYPEIILNHYNHPLDPVDTRSDIYAYGMVLFEMFYGKNASEQEGSLKTVPVQKAKADCDRLFTRLCEERNLNPQENRDLYKNLKICIDYFLRLRRQSLPQPSPNQSLNRIIFKCLELYPDRRYSNFREIHDDLAYIYKETKGKEYKEPTQLPDVEALLRGPSLTALGKYEEALENINDVIEISPELASGWASKGVLLAKLGRNEESLGLFDKALKIIPNDAEALTCKGASLNALGRYEEALKCLEKALKINPQNEAAWHNKGVCLVSYKKDHKAAIRCYDKAIAINPRSPEIWIGKGLSLGNLGKYEEALDSFNRALDLDPRQANAVMNKGGVYTKINKYEEALECFDEVIRLDPENSEGWYNRGVAFVKSGNDEEALVCLEKATELTPNNAQYWFNRGGILAGLGRYEEAIACLKEVLEIDPNYKMARESMQVFQKAIERENRTNNAIEASELCDVVITGDRLLELGKPDEALIYYNKALEMDPKSALLWINKGTSLAAQGRHKEALTCFKQATKLDPGEAKAWYNSSISLGILGRIEEALNCCEEAIKIEPSNAGAWYNKGVLLAKLGRYKEAIACYDEAIEKNPKEALAWYNKGRLLAKRWKFREGSACIRKALEIDPTVVRRNKQK